MIRRPTGSAVPYANGGNVYNLDEVRNDSEVGAARRLRRDLWEHGYRPIAVYSPGAVIDGEPVVNAGKRPAFNDWIGLARRDPPDAVTRPPSMRSLNTGILTGEVSVVDVDVLVAEVADPIVSVIERKLGTTPLHRIGRSPKRALYYRAEVPFKKLKTAVYVMPDDSDAAVEVLGEGQCFVAFGTHPGTLRPYSWPKALPLDVPLRDLPVVTAEEAQAIIDEAEAILRGAGGVLRPKKQKSDTEPPKPGHKQERSSGDGDSFFHAVNSKALGNIAAWVTALHSDFRDRGNSGWRLSSKDLGRNLEEDISVHPSGIWDFGEEEPLSAIDLVIKLRGAADAVQAALWLCERLRIEPASLGWRGERQEHPDEGHDPEEPDDTARTRSATINATNLHGKIVPVRRWAIEDWIPARRVSAVYGHGGEGKTTILHQLQVDAALGTPWLGLPVAAVRSLGVYCEDDDEEMHIRQDIINRRYECDYPELAGVYWKARRGEDNLLMTFDSRSKAEPTRFWYDLRDEACDLEVDFIIIDTVTDCFGGKENDRAQVRQFGQWALGGLARAIDGAVIVTAHPSMQGINTGSGTSGTTEWEAVFRSRIYMTRPKTETGEPDDSDRRLLTRKKANYARRDETIELYWHEGVFRCNKASVNHRRRPCEQVFLALLDKLTDQGRTVTYKPNAGNYAPRVFVKQAAEARDNYKVKDFEAAMEALFDRQAIRKHEYRDIHRNPAEGIMRNIPR